MIMEMDMDMDILTDTLMEKRKLISENLNPLSNLKKLLPKKAQRTSMLTLLIFMLLVICFLVSVFALLPSSFISGQLRNIHGPNLLILSAP
jgi:hypothetical protein|tara:strand:- start:442 stop:714 length:273 start_codon:yes stop_codon:yes gene_type:complete